MRLVSSLVIAVLMTAPSFAVAAATAQQTCTKMIAEGRFGGQDHAECLCAYRVADAVLDDDIKALLFESWYSGKNNMQAVSRLPRQGRIKRQFNEMRGSLQSTCGVLFRPQG